jgi:hypothetical protein
VRIKFVFNICLKEIEFDDVDWIYFALDEVKWWDLVNCSNDPSSFIKGGKFLD